jgi:hypothetical protein
MTPRPTQPTRILVVADDSTLDRSLLSAVAHRAVQSPADFTLLIPAVARGLHRVVDPEDHGTDEAEAALEAAIPVMSQAAGAPVIGVVGGHDSFAAVWDALNFGAYDEVILATRSSRFLRWLRLDLARRIAALGVPVTAVGASGLPQAA